MSCIQGTCHNCTHFVKSLTIVQEDNNIIVTLPEIYLQNHDKICVCLVQSLPSEITAETTVTFKIGTSPIATLLGATKRGNFLYADALKSRKVYPFIVATDTNVLVLEDMCRLGSTKHSFPTIPPTV